MKIILFNHPSFFESCSITKYTLMIARGMERKGHQVQIWTAPPILNRLKWPVLLKKYIGYIDQFIFFPMQVKFQLRNLDRNTLFVFSDQALGPWVPLVLNRPHVIHCHDFMAQKSANGEIEENRIKWPGKVYQRYIRRGFVRGSNFICISKKTREDLKLFLSSTPKICDVIYNGLNQDFQPSDQEAARFNVSAELNLPLSNGFVLHVGGNHFYKNRIAILKIYTRWRSETKDHIPLLFVGAGPDEEMKIFLNQCKFTSDIFFAPGVSDKLLRTCYQAATVLLFPSLEEGFGWPIAEAMASGCPVITTEKAPMTEVGGSAAIYVPPFSKRDENTWLKECAGILGKIISLPNSEREQLVARGINNAKRFNSEDALQAIEDTYQKVLQHWTNSASHPKDDLLVAK